MKSLLFVRFTFFGIMPILFLALKNNAYCQKQNFEETFIIESIPNQFLPDWYGNEVRSSNSRIFQAKGLGINGSNSLAVQPISSFDGELIVMLNSEGFQSPMVKFWARSIKNGTGNRSAQVYISWSGELDSGYDFLDLVGSEMEFKNEDQEFRRFQFELPEEIKNSPKLFLKFEIRYGSGSGSCARWLLDDFEFGDFVEDKESPKIAKIRGVEENEIQVGFSERIDPIFSIVQLNYKLNGIEPESVILNLDSLVTLTFSDPLDHGTDYILDVSQIPDLEGNFLKDTLVNFKFFDPTFVPAKSLVINEVMPAPKADLDLPNVEYVEILNTADYPIRTIGMTWSNSRSTVSLPDVWIEPLEYHLLVPSNQVVQMENFEKLIPLNSWPTLLNSGDQLFLKDKNGNTTDFLSYSLASWGESELSSLGYSLEVFNPFLACDQSALLKASIDELRGTPGKQNSVWDISSDENPPFIAEFAFQDSLSVFIRFSEPIQPNFEKENFIFNSDLAIDSIFRVSSTTILIQLKKPAKPSLEYVIQIDSIFDCYGNSIELKVYKIIFPSTPQKGEIIINELLFNPKTGRPKFVELYNKSLSFLQIGNLKLANLDENGAPDQIKSIKDSGFILAPGAYLVITTDTLKLKQDFPKSSFGKFLEIASLPSYPIAGGTVVLLNQDGEILEEFSFDEDMHHSLLRDPKGVSLERVSSESPADLRINWHSASNLEDYGTPGKKNSQAFSNEFDTEIITISPEVFDPEGSNGNTFTIISYQLDQSGWVGTFEIYDVSGRLIEVLDRNAIMGSSGIYTWTGTDNLGGKVRPGYYVLLVELFDLKGEVMVLKKTIVIATRF